MMDSPGKEDATSQCSAWEGFIISFSNIGEDSRGLLTNAEFIHLIEQNEEKMLNIEKAAKSSREGGLSLIGPSRLNASKRNLSATADLFLNPLYINRNGAFISE